jgi:hypothetical protein
MISEAYSKHMKSLCRSEDQVLHLRDEDLQGLREYGKRVGRRIKDIYDPFSTSLPNKMASIETSRLEGGNLQALKENGSLNSFSGHPLLRLQKDSNCTRLEPFVVGLFGPPGSGKTTLCNKIVQYWKRTYFPDFSREEVLYSRNCGTKHWDGYEGQPIIVLDDFGQDLSDRSDLVEFETLISINDYVVPMADLQSKGRKFRSPLVLVTSNMAFGETRIKDGSSSDVMEDPMALWRRFDFPLLIRNEDGERHIHRLRASWGPRLTEHNKRKFDPLDDNHPKSGFAPSKTEVLEKIEESSLFSELSQNIFQKFTYHKRTFGDSWEQSISSKSIRFVKESEGFWKLNVHEDPQCFSAHSRSLLLSFPSDPPDHPPVVKAHAIPEPLKVRMITIGETDTKVLQPLQKALWEDLGNQPQFCLTNGVKILEDFQEETLPWIKRIESEIQRILKESKTRTGEIISPELTRSFFFPDFLKNRVLGQDKRKMDEDSPSSSSFSYLNPKDGEEFWLSGDYTAATDNFPMEATRALMDGILSEIDHEPTRKWALWEISSHVIKYPKGTQGIQTSGQLMGSLLSFPLLCYLNDYIVSSSGFVPGSYLVNGDDIVARGSISAIRTWSARAPQVGLSLSLGKNFVDRQFCTVNSQLFFEGRLKTTGKVSTQHRLGSTLSHCFSESQFHWGVSPQVKEIFLKRNWTVLRRTPRSMDISRRKGGLGLITNPTCCDMKLAKRVYLYDLLHSFGRVYPIPNTKDLVFVPIPVIRLESPKSDHQPYHYETEEDRELKSIQRSYLGEEVNTLRLLNVEGAEEPAFDDLTHQELSSWWTNLASKDREFFRELEDFTEQGYFSLFECPSLNRLSKRFVPMSSDIGRQVSRLIRRHLFFSVRDGLVDSDPVWSGEGYLREVLDFISQHCIRGTRPADPELGEEVEPVSLIPLFEEEKKDNLVTIPEEEEVGGDYLMESLKNFFIPFDEESEFFPFPHDGEFHCRDRVDYDSLLAFLGTWSPTSSPEDPSQTQPMTCEAAG